MKATHKFCNKVFDCLLLGQEEYCCKLKEVDDQTYYYVESDDIAYEYGCKSNCIYKKSYGYGYNDETKYKTLITFIG